MIQIWCHPHIDSRWSQYNVSKNTFWEQKRQEVITGGNPPICKGWETVLSSHLWLIPLLGLLPMFSRTSLHKLFHFSLLFYHLPFPIGIKAHFSLCHLKRSFLNDTVFPVITLHYLNTIKDLSTLTFQFSSSHSLLKYILNSAQFLCESSAL